MAVSELEVISLAVQLLIDLEGLTADWISAESKAGEDERGKLYEGNDKEGKNERPGEAGDAASYLQADLFAIAIYAAAGDASAVKEGDISISKYPRQEHPP